MRIRELPDWSPTAQQRTTLLINFPTWAARLVAKAADTRICMCVHDALVFSHRRIGDSDVPAGAATVVEFAQTRAISGGSRVHTESHIGVAFHLGMYGARHRARNGGDLMTRVTNSNNERGLICFGILMRVV